MQLQILQRPDAIPVSVEWTVPFRDTYFHVGLHNLPPRKARAMMGEMERLTARPEPRRLPEMLASFHADRHCLIVPAGHTAWHTSGHEYAASVFDGLYCDAYAAAIVSSGSRRSLGS